MASNHLEVPLHIYTECGGRILKGAYSQELKQHVAHYINCCYAMEKIGSPSIIYISAWKEESAGESWYEYVHERFARLFRCKRSEVVNVFRNSIKETVVYRYADSHYKAEKEGETIVERQRSGTVIRTPIKKRGTFDAVYKMLLNNKKEIWLKDLAMVESYPADKVFLSLGSLSIVTREMRKEEERLQKERLQVTLQMAGAVCHELNQPLQGIFGYSETLLMRFPEGDPLNYKVKKIIELTNRMGKITKKLMRITKYETKDYVHGIKIIDIDKSATALDDE
jgi:C4-dicarboxylate-specific signal transduction histidine kinase